MPVVVNMLLELHPHPHPRSLIYLVRYLKTDVLLLDLVDEGPFRIVNSWALVRKPLCALCIVVNLESRHTNSKSKRTDLFDCRECQFAVMRRRR